MKYPTITKHNLDAWESITYSHIINGMKLKYPQKSYGELMNMAEALTVRLFRALKRDMRTKEKKKNGR